MRDAIATVVERAEMAIFERVSFGNRGLPYDRGAKHRLRRHTVTVKNQRSSECARSITVLSRLRPNCVSIRRSIARLDFEGVLIARLIADARSEGGLNQKKYDAP